MLVTFASRHGATRQIAARLAQWLQNSDVGRRSGLTAVLAPVQHHPEPADFDAVVLGSAVYSGRWLEPALRYADVAAPQLRSRPTWLFSSGLRHASGASAAPGEIEDVRRISDSIGAEGHRHFSGRLEPRLLSADERSAWSSGDTITGDFRDWAAARAWPEQITTRLLAPRTVSAAG